MGIWIDQITLYCDSCEATKVMSVNVEKYSVNDAATSDMRLDYTAVDWIIGEEDEVSCPKCTALAKLEYEHETLEHNQAIGAWEGTLGASGLETLE